MTSLEEGIDELYKGPLSDFIAGRTALARTLKGAGAQHVKAQQKPRVGAWAVNQVYWHARPLWDRVAKSGEKLRAEQIAALKGRRADLRSATEAHHKAIATAVTQALRFASDNGVQPSADELARTFEALSLAREWPEPPGRLTRPLQPAGFEALAGVVVKARAAGPTTHPAPHGPAREKEAGPRRDRSQAAADRQKEAARLKAEAAAARARAAVARAEAAETRARQAWERTKQELERALHQARQSE